MDIDKAMIFVSMIILVGVLSFAGISSGEFGFPDKSNDLKIPNITSSTDTTHDGFYNYCYRMGFEC